MVNDRLLLSIGRVAVAAGNTEVGGYLIIWALEYNNFARTDALVHGRQFQGVVDLGRRLADATWPSADRLPDEWEAREWIPERPRTHSDLHTWLSRASDFMAKRNRILHSGAMDEVGLSRFRPGREKGHFELRVEDVEALAEEGEALVASVSELVESIRHQLPKREPVLRDLTEIAAEQSQRGFDSRGDNGAPD